MKTVHIYHYLPPLKSQKWPKTIGTWVYIEGKESLIVWYWMSSQGRYGIEHIYSVDDMSVEDLDALIRRHWGRSSPAYILGIFVDIIYPQSTLPWIIEGLGYELTDICIRPNASIFYFHDPRKGTLRRSRQIVISDIMCILPMIVLRELERLYKLKELSDIYANSLRVVTDYWSAILALLVSIRHHLEGCSFRPTASGIGMSWLRHKFLHSKDVACPMHYPTWCDLRDSVFTSPVEVRRTGKLMGRYYYCDANNLYLWAAAYRDMPGPPIVHLVLPTPDELKWNLAKNACSAYVQVRWCRYRWPYRGQLSDLDAKSHTVHTWLSGDELKLAYEGGYLKNVYSMHVFAKSPTIEQYARSALSVLQELKSTADRTYYYAVKHILLAALGRFASKGYRSILLKGQVAPTFWGFEPPPHQAVTNYCHMYVMGRVYRVEWGMPTALSAPQVFAHVTAAARRRMFELLDVLSDDDIIYRDVDAVIVDEASYKHLCDNDRIRKEPGFLSVKAVGENCEIFAARHYRVGTRLVQAGLPVDVTVPGMTRERHYMCSIPDIELYASPDPGQLTPVKMD